MSSEIFLNFIERFNAALRNSANASDILKKPDLLKEFGYWYERMTGTKFVNDGCHVCIYEHFVILRNMSKKEIENRLNVTHLIKPGEILWHESRPFTRESLHITQEIIDYFLAKWPHKMEAARFAAIPEPKSLEILTPGYTPPDIFADVAPEKEENAPQIDAIKPVFDKKSRKKRR